MEAITWVTLEPSDFNGRVCCTGEGRVCGEDASMSLITKSSPVLYYVRSWPHLDTPDGQPKEVHDLALYVLFYHACSAWTRCTGIRFERTDEELKADFYIRAASKTEEKEQRSRVCEAFDWSTPHTKVVRLWHSLGQYQPYAIFLHCIGHILGFRHAHAQWSVGRRLGLHEQEQLEFGSTQAFQCSDPNSIMSFDYLSRCTVPPGEENKQFGVYGVKLSHLDQIQARRAYQYFPLAGDDY